MSIFLPFSILDYLELTGLILAVCDFTGFTKLLEKKIDSIRKKFGDFLKLNFLFIYGEDQYETIEETYDELNIDTKRITRVIGDSYQQEIGLEQIHKALFTIILVISILKAKIRRSYGSFLGNIFGFVTPPIAIIIYFVLLFLSVFFFLFSMPIWFLLILINMPPSGTVGSLSLLVAIAAFFGSRLAS